MPPILVPKDKLTESSDFMKQNTLISVQSLSKYYGNLYVLDNISFNVSQGEFLALVGPSGCGKTTLLKVIGGILKASSGKILLRSAEVATTHQKGEIGFVFQNPALLPWRTLYENVRLPLEILKRNESENQISRILDIVGLNGFENALPKQLSGGMQQRASLAQVLVFHPSVLLMDEPFAAVDELTRERLNYELLSLWKKIQSTILFVTHSIPEAVFMADRVIVLSQRPARIVSTVRIDLARPRDQETATSTEYLQIVNNVRTCLSVK